MGTQMSFLQFFRTDKTAKNITQGLWLSKHLDNFISGFSIFCYLVDCATNTTVANTEPLGHDK